ncbi:phage integrase N-terminal domain-containing protein [Cupriavidus basilensis]
MKPKHVAALVNRWQASGIAVGTMKNRMSAAKGGKCGGGQRRSASRIGGRPAHQCGEPWGSTGPAPVCAGE